MSVKLNVNGLYIDPNFTHTKTKYILSEDKNLISIIDEHTSENNDELYEYEFDTDIRIHQSLYYMIIVTLEDSDENEYEISDGVLDCNVFGQVVGETSLIKTPTIEVTDYGFSRYKQLSIKLTDEKVLSKNDSIINTDLLVKNFSGEELFSIKKNVEDVFKLPVKFMDKENFIIEGRFNGSLSNSLYGRKLIINNEVDNFIELISEPFLYKGFNRLNFKSNSTINGIVNIEILDSTTNNIILRKESISVEFVFDSFILEFDTKIIENDRKYFLKISSEKDNFKFIENTIELTGKVGIITSEVEVTYNDFKLDIISNNKNILINSKGFTKHFINDMLPISGYTSLSFYDFNDRVMNNNYKYQYSFRDIQNTNVEFDNKNLFIHNVIKNNNDEIKLLYFRLAYDGDGSISNVLNTDIVDYGDNYIDLFDITDEYYFILDKNDGDGFKGYQQDKIDGTMNELTDTIDDLNEYRDLITVDDSILISSIKIDDYIYTFAKGLVCKINLSDSSVEKFYFSSEDMEKIKLYKTNKTILMTGKKISNDRIFILEFDLNTNEFTRSINTDLNFERSIIFIDTDNKLSILNRLSDNHILYTLN